MTAEQDVRNKVIESQHYLLVLHCYYAKQTVIEWSFSLLLKVL